jgi:hypothetical protein
MLWVLWTLLMVTTTHGLVVTPLKGGVQVRERDMRIVVETWRVIVTVEDMITPYASLREGISMARGATRRVLSSTEDHNHNRRMRHFRNVLDGLETKVAAWEKKDKRPRRTRRGLINGVGLLMGQVFGVATESEIIGIKQRVADNTNTIKEMLAWEEDNIAILNASFHNIELNSVAVLALREEAAAEDKVGVIREAMERVERERARQSEIIDDLEGGRLTESLFPPALFNDIKISKDCDWLEKYWYYQYTTIHPVWVANHAGVKYFSFSLPLVARTNRQGYELKSFPIRYKNTTAKIAVPHYASLDLLTGMATEPTFCLGSEPQACNEGPTASACVNSLLGGGDWDECYVQFERTADRYYMLTPSSLVLVSLKDSLIQERCLETLVSAKQAAPAGTVVVKWTPGCRVITEKFTVRSPRHQEMTLAWASPQDELDLAAMLHDLETPDVGLQVVRLGSLQKPPKFSEGSAVWAGTYPDWFPWFTVITIIQIVTIIYIFKNKFPICKSRRCWKRAKTMAPPPETDALEGTTESPSPQAAIPMVFK